MKIIFFIVATLTSISFFYLDAFGTIYVPDNFSTIQAAIDSAYGGETIIVRSGSYSGEGNVNISFKGKAITLKSQSGPENTIIDCQENSRGFIFNNNEGVNSVLDGFKIINGFSDKGGAIYCEGSPTIKNCIFDNNTAENIGGGIYCNGSGTGTGSPSIISCSFNNNKVTTSGSLRGNGGAIAEEKWGHPIVKECSITLNSAYNNGGGISGKADIFDCHFKNNSAGSSGGGVYLEGTIYNSTFSENTAGMRVGGYGGGAIKCIWSTVTNCIVDKNFSLSGEGGGGIHSSDSDIINCVITNNSASGNGGGILSGLGNNIVNCTIKGNIASSKGGGVFGSSSSPITLISNSIIVFNTPNEIDSYSEAFTVTYSNVLGGFAGIGNIDFNPNFFSSDYLNLNSDSPCLNVGNNSATGIYPTDIEGNSRIEDGTVDMGAYERNPNSPISDFTGSPLSGQSPLAVKFSDQSANAPYTWSWNFGDGNKSTEESPIHVFVNPGIYSVTLSTYNEFGRDQATKPDFITVTVCESDPVRIGQLSYISIQDAYDEAEVSGDIIESQAFHFNELLCLNKDIEIAFKGGKNCDFSQGLGNSSIEMLTIEDGTAEIQAICIQGAH